jgi:hypothetical protein
MTEAFRYVKAQKNGLAAFSTYPYTSGTTKVAGTCNSSAAAQGIAPISGYSSVAQGEDNLAAAIAGQPVAVAVDATNWSTYVSGIFTNCGTALNHGVVAVGYSLNSYWLVQNSWGTGWGQSGYIQVGWKTNCGIANSASFPTL